MLLNCDAGEDSLDRELQLRSYESYLVQLPSWRVQKVENKRLL